MTKPVPVIRVTGKRIAVSNGTLDSPPTGLASHIRPDAIDIDLIGGRYRLKVTSYRRMQADPDLAPKSVYLPGSPASVVSAIKACLAVWQKVVDHRQPFPDGDELPFQDCVDLKSRPDLLQKFGPGLARAGNDLHAALFGKPEPDSEVADLIAGVTAEPNHFTIRSNELFAPWPMLYSCPDGGILDPTGKDWKPEGFWGFRHVFDHRIDENDHYANIPLPGNVLRVSLNFDPKIDVARGHPVVEGVRKYLEKYPPPLRVEVPQRTTADSLLGVLRDGEFSERIAYFCCHQNDDPTAIVLDDDANAVTVASLVNAAETGHPRGFGRELFVFFNTCQGGRISEKLLESFAPAWLRLDANCVLGAQVDVPALFAKAYAERFFARVLPGMRFGDAVRELTVEFMAMNNPLGLIYCLYRGSTARILSA